MLRILFIVSFFWGAQVAAESSSAKRELVVGGGCFWCVEAVYQSLIGVEAVESGYSGGETANPTYEQVSSGESGHAEVVKITYDPALITLPELLEAFFHTHDPTTLNRQGNDVGTQYRSVIFYSSPEEKKAIDDVKAKIEANKLWPNPIVTQIAPLRAYYKAEDYHQNYYRTHSSQPYCSIVIAPKLQKLYKAFASKLKKQ